MALAKFVNNVVDLSDDSGFKFRFQCDRCRDGFESEYQRSSTDILTTAVTVLSSFTSFGYGGRTIADKVGQGLRGQEHTVAYEKAVSQAMVHFKKCSACGHWVCPQNCWNSSAGMCETCAPNAQEAGAKQSAKMKAEEAIKAAQGSGLSANPALVTCPACQQQNQGGKFCANCGASLSLSQNCVKCHAKLLPDARFCNECGTRRG